MRWLGLRKYWPSGSNTLPPFEQEYTIRKEYLDYLLRIGLQYDQVYNIYNQRFGKENE